MVRFENNLNQIQEKATNDNNKVLMCIRRLVTAQAWKALHNKMDQEHNFVIKVR